ncbi:MAG: glycosyltransferase, partial [Candidatus Dormibacteraeota bacterium]|nr:glycosyltransferase [Candidatus Dormibacteraeota bacterium]
MTHVAAASVVGDGSRVPIPAPASPRVSVVIPTYNRADSLRRLLRSLARIPPLLGGLEI